MSVLPIVDIRADGQKIPDHYNLLALEAITRVNKIPYAELKLQDGDAAAQDFLISSERFFQPGNKVQIKLGTQNNDLKTVFEGVVVKQRIKTSRNGSILLVSLQDASGKLNSSRKSAVFNQITDSQMIQKLITEAGLMAGKIDKTNVTHAQLIQYQTNDWDFMLSRADVCGRLVFASAGNIDLREPKLTGNVAFSFNYGISDCIDFDFSLDTQSQYQQAQANYWNIDQQKVNSETVSNVLTLKQGNVKVSDTAKVLNKTEYQLDAAVNMPKQEAKAWAESQLIRERLSLFRGTLTLDGRADLEPGQLLEIKGVGERFSGNTLITGIGHRITTNGWQTQVQFGIHPQSYQQSTPHVNQPAASGLTPAISGLQVGIVAAFEQDPEKLDRIKVSLPAIQSTGQSTGQRSQNNVVWARLVMPYAGKQKGVIFTPDPGDEVIVGFVNDDPRQALLLGACFSPKNPLPKGFNLTQSNAIKGMVSNSDLRVAFDDDDKTITLSTPANNTVILNDKKQHISLTDQHGNQILLDANGIALTSDKAITLSARQQLSADATKGVKLAASGGDIQLNGVNIDANAKAAFKAKGSASANLEASGITTVKGAMVKIN